MKQLFFNKHILIYLMALSSAILLIGSIFNISVLQFKIGIIGDIAFIISSILPFIIFPIFLASVFGLFHNKTYILKWYHRLIYILIVILSTIYGIISFGDFNILGDFIYSNSYYILWSGIGFSIACINMVKK
jgi:hypothetical protein